MVGRVGSQVGTAQDCREEQALNRLTVMAGNTRVVGRDLNIMSTNVWPFWLKISTEPRLVVPTHPVPCSFLIELDEDLCMRDAALLKIL